MPLITMFLFDVGTVPTVWLLLLFFSSNHILRDIIVIMFC